MDYRRAFSASVLALSTSMFTMGGVEGQATTAQPPAVPQTPGSAWAVMEVLDLNEDGFSDVILADEYGRVVQLTNDGKGCFEPPNELCPAVSEKSGSVAIKPMDFETDGDRDLLLFVGNGSLFRLVNNGKGQFAAPERLSEALTTTAQWVAIEVVDANSDGESDAVILAENGDAYLLPSDGKGGHLAPQKIELGAPQASSVRHALTADVNGDGHRDIVLSTSDGTVYSLVNDGKGSFKKQ